MTPTELDMWVERMSAAVVDRALRVGLATSGGSPMVEDVTDQVLTLVQRYQEMRAAPPTPPARERIAALREAEQVLVVATGGNGTAVRKEIQRLCDSYCFDVLREEASSCRTRAEAAWATGNKVGSQRLHDQAADLEARIRDALPYEARRGK